MIIIKKAIKREPKLNLLWNCYNPIKIWVLIIDLIKSLNKTIGSSEEELKSLENEMIEIILSIVSDVEVPGILRYWLYDEINEEFKVIDLLAHLNLLSILNHAKITRTVEHIWRGTYDWSNNVGLESTITRGVLAVNFRKYYIPADTVFTMIGFNKNGTMIKYIFKLTIDVIKNSLKFKRSNHILFKLGEKIKLPTYGYVAYTDSIYLQFFIDLILLVLFSIAYWLILLYETHSRAQMETTYATITNLKAQTQTASVLSSIETNYATLQSQGETWYYRFTWMIILNTYFVSCFIQDLMIVLTYFAKGISLRLLSPNFIIVFCANLVHFILAVNLIKTYYSEYAIVVN